MAATWRGGLAAVRRDESPRENDGQLGLGSSDSGVVVVRWCHGRITTAWVEGAALDPAMKGHDHKHPSRVPQA